MIETWIKATERTPQMNIYSFKDLKITDSFEKAYGILCSSVAGSDRHRGLTPTFCRVPPLESTNPHAHFEEEIFLILKGLGRMCFGSDGMRVTSEALVSEGDLVRIPSGTRHWLQNLQTGELEFLSVYSEDFVVKAAPKSVVVTTAPPTPNGPLHLGHISGPYLAADIIARSLRSQGSQVVSHSGTDDHQNYVTERARALSTDEETFRRDMRQRILDGLSALNISYNEFIEPASDPKTAQLVQALLARGLQSGVLQEEEVAFPFCTHCDHSLFDARLSGLCPGCGSACSGGCEECGLVSAPPAVLQPACARCGAPAVLRSVKTVQFELASYLPAIAAELETLSLSPRVRELVAMVRGLKECKVMIADPEGNAHVWFEMAANYEAFALGERTWIHAFGFDNSFYYLLFIPALLRALNPLARLPDKVITNEFLQLEGKKFSTSRNHAIWSDEFRGDPEHLRLYLALHRPSVKTENFMMNHFVHFSEALGLQLRGLLTVAAANYEDPTSASTGQGPGALEAHRFTRDMDRFLSVEEFDLRRAARRVVDYLDVILNCTGLADDKLCMLRALALSASPILPKFSTELQQSLGQGAALGI